MQPGVFDPTPVLRLVRGNASREQDVINMIERLVRDADTPVRRGCRLLAAGELEAARRHFHSLKGSLGNFGAQRSVWAAEALEQALSQDECQFEALLQAFAGELAATVTAAKAWLQSYHLGRSGAAPVLLPAAEFAKRRQLLDSLLAGSEIAALDVFNELAPQLEQWLAQECYQALQGAMEQLDFARARVLLSAD